MGRSRSQHAFVQASGPQAEGFQFGGNDLRKRGAVAFDRQERQLLDFGQNARQGIVGWLALT